MAQRFATRRIRFRKKPRRKSRARHFEPDYTRCISWTTQVACAAVQTTQDVYDSWNHTSSLRSRRDHTRCISWTTSSLHSCPERRSLSGPKLTATSSHERALSNKQTNNSGWFSAHLVVQLDEHDRAKECQRSNGALHPASAGHSRAILPSRTSSHTRRNVQNRHSAIERCRNKL
jgi:hypothetical protein